jgi:hypothetical protein
MRDFVLARLKNDRLKSGTLKKGEGGWLELRLALSTSGPSGCLPGMGTTTGVGLPP